MSFFFFSSKVGIEKFEAGTRTRVQTARGALIVAVENVRNRFNSLVVKTLDVVTSNEFKYRNCEFLFFIQFSSVNFVND